MQRHRETIPDMLIKQKGFAAYPPTLEHVELLGYVEEVNGIFHSRDIGRSFKHNGQVFLSFGDTFCDDSEGQFVGLTNNTVAVIEDIHEPLKSKYLEVGENGIVKPFIGLTPEEQKIEDDKKGRVILWAFGGVVEIDDRGTGYLWYQKSIDHGCDNLEYIGTGIAKVTESYGCEQQPCVQRFDGLLWGSEHPRMGTFTAIKDGGFFYLYGDRPDGKIILARIYITWLYGFEDRHLRSKGNYQYWGGAGWVHDWHKAAVVIEGMQQGAIVRSKLFGDDKPFVFVGTSKWADSQVFMGASAKLEGPWTLEPVCKVEGIKEPTSKGKWMYCIYPHLWASGEEYGELFVTWSEHYPGGVIAAKIKLAALEEEASGV